MPESWWNMKHRSVSVSNLQSWIPLKGCQSNPISPGSGGLWKRPSKHLKMRRWSFIFTDGGDKTGTTEIKMTKGRSRGMTEREREKQQVVIHSGAGQTGPHCWMCYLCLVWRQGHDPGQMWMGYRGKGLPCRCSDARSQHLCSADLHASTGHLQGPRKVKMRACPMQDTETTVLKQVLVC